jgi:hypothetical protein
MKKSTIRTAAILGVIAVVLGAILPTLMRSVFASDKGMLIAEIWQKEFAEPLETQRVHGTDGVDIPDAVEILFGKLLEGC